MPLKVKRSFVHVGSPLSLAGLFVLISGLESTVRIGIDSVVAGYMNSIQTPSGLIAMKVLTDTFRPEVIIILTALIVCFCLYKKYFYTAVMFALITTAGAVSQWWLKNTLQDQRPEHSFFIESSYSFPSGHATMVVVFFLLLGYFFIMPRTSTIIRWSMFVACGLIVLAVGLSRLYLGVHWASDVVGGYILGIFWVSTGLLIMKNNFVFTQHETTRRKNNS